MAVWQEEEPDTRWQVALLQFSAIKCGMFQPWYIRRPWCSSFQLHHATCWCSQTILPCTTMTRPSVLQQRTTDDGYWMLDRQITRSQMVIKCLMDRWQVTSSQMVIECSTDNRWWLLNVWRILDTQTQPNGVIKCLIDRWHAAKWFLNVQLTTTYDGY